MDVAQNNEKPFFNFRSLIWTDIYRYSDVYLQITILTITQQNYFSLTGIRPLTRKIEITESFWVVMCVPSPRIEMILRNSSEKYPFRICYTSRIITITKRRIPDVLDIILFGRVLESFIRFAWKKK